MRLFMFTLLFLFSFNVNAKYSKPTYASQGAAKSACDSSGGGSCGCGILNLASYGVHMCKGSGSNGLFTYKPDGSSCTDPMVPDSNGMCIDAPSCPSAGTEVSKLREQTKNLSNDSVGPLTISVGGGNSAGSVNGCGISPVKQDVECYTASEASKWDITIPSTGIPRCYQVVGYQYTGGTSGADTVDVGSNPDFPDVEPIKGDYLEDDRQTVQGDVITETVGDSTVVAQTNTEIETKGRGVTVKESTDIKEINITDGLIKTETVTTKTTTNSDGSKTVEIATHSSYTQSEMEVITVKKDDGTISIIKNPSYTGSSTTTTTTDYGADGTETGSSTRTTNEGGDGNGASQGGNDDSTSGDGDGDEDRQGAPDGGLYESSDLTYDSVLGNFKSGIESSPIVSGVGSYFTLSVSGSCPTWSASIWFTDIVIDQQCEPFFRNALQAAGYLLLGFVGYRSFLLAVS